MTKHLYLVDISSFIFRAYYALPKLTRRQDGLPIGAVAGVCSMLHKLLCDIGKTQLQERPTHLAIIFDHSRNSFRQKLYSQYKANRRDTPADLAVQFGLIRQAVENFNLMVIEQEGYEADDIIASYAKLVSKEGSKVTIISGDKDLTQLLVYDNIAIYDPSSDKTIGKDEVIKKYGVLPQQMIDYQALVGDSSDNIPGVKGIGPKGAAALLNEYGDLQNIYENLGNITKKSLRENLEKYKEQAFLSYDLAKLCVDMDLPVDWHDFALVDWRTASLLSFLKGLGLNSLLKRIAAESEVDLRNIEPIAINVDWQGEELGQEELKKTAQVKQVSLDFERKAAPEKSKNGDLLSDVADKKLYLIDKYRKGLKQSKGAEDIEDIAELDRWLEKISDRHKLYIYIEDNIAYLALDFDDFISCDVALLTKSRFVSLLADESVAKIFYDAKQTMRILEDNLGEQINLASIDDARLMAYVLDNEVKLDITNLVRVYFGVFEEADYFYIQALVALYELFRVSLIDRGLYNLYWRCEREMPKVIYAMESSGIRIDVELLKKLSLKFAKQLEELEAQIYSIAGENFNIGSPKQISSILFEKMNLVGGKKTKTGNYSTDIFVLDDLAASGVEIAQKIVRWRQIAKLKNTYSDSLVNHIDDNYKVHTNYLLAATNTARLSSINPNLQNIPSRTEEGRSIREAFIADEGKILLCADYNQIELRLLAQIADVKGLKKAFLDKEDVHTRTAANIFAIEPDLVTREQRAQAKAINFGIIYGMSAFGLAKHLQISTSDANLYIKAYFAQYPEIKRYIEETRQFVNENYYVKNIFGREIQFKALKKAKGAFRANLERAAINAVIQSSAADVIRLAMINLHQYLRQSHWNAKMLLQIHDELIFEVEKDKAVPFSKEVVEYMKDIDIDAQQSLKDLLDVGVGIAENWAQAH